MPNDLESTDNQLSEVRLMEALSLTVKLTYPLATNQFYHFFSNFLFKKQDMKNKSELRK